MLLKYFFNPNLAHASYLVGCQATGEAIVIDPARNVEPYLAAAAEHGLKLIAAAETHIHADFLSGSRELTAQTGARLYLSDEGEAPWKYEFVPDYPHRLLEDGDYFKIGNIRFEVMHTPGHTPEHLAFLVTDTAGADQPIGIFTGDFVFVGDVGRPDLLETAAGFKGTAELGARRLFRALQRFKGLPDYLQLWPAHGAGSACGKALGAIPSSTVGYEKLFNLPLSFTDEARFIEAILAGQPEPPKYFAMMKKLNKTTRPVLSALPQPPRLELAELQAVLAQRATVVDTRPSVEFAAGHLPGTINLPLDKAFTGWAGWLLSYEQPFYLIGNETTVPQAVQALVEIGLDQVAGYFDPSLIEQWPGALQQYELTTPREIAGQVIRGEVTVLDVRSLNEWQEGHIPGAHHIMLGYLLDRAGELPRNKPLLVHCGVHGRSPIAASILQAKGFPQVILMREGYTGWARAGLPIEAEAKEMVGSR
jgi:hydroxyacylglutathione hydrolase